MLTMKRMKDTKWLAKRLGLSVSTIERLRSQESPDIPRPLFIGTVIRYDALFVEYFLLKRVEPSLPPFSVWATANISKYEF